jgi:hypothetical protein
MSSTKSTRAAWLAVGVVIGLCVAGFWPDAPSHASATAQVENFAIATGPVEPSVEAIFFLDPLTGDLSAAVLSPRSGVFNAFYKTNVLEALGVDPGNDSGKPQYLMVTGVNEFQRSAGAPQLGSTVVYVADATSGTVAAYGLPWTRQIANATQPVYGAMHPLDKVQARNIQIREP